MRDKEITAETLKNGKKQIKSTWVLSDGSSQLQLLITYDEFMKMDLSENVKEFDIVSVSHLSLKSVQIKGSPVQIFFLKAPV